MFRHPDDKESEKVFTEAVIRELADQKGKRVVLSSDFPKPLNWNFTIIWSASKHVFLWNTFSASINCLVADGKKFAHPLHHLGKRESDLPLIAIDSFRHMYLFPNTNDMT